MIYATSNLGKLNEVNQALGQVVRGIDKKNLELDIIESGSTYLENATIKAKKYSEKLNQPVISDDGGLELASFPDRLGLHTSRAFPKNWTDSQINQEIISWLNGVSDTRAYLVTALSYWDPNENKPIFQTQVKLEFLICQEERGSWGYGFDSILLVENLGLTVAQLKSPTRYQYSSRIVAFKRLLDFLRR